MPRDRQRSKQRQAARREARLRDRAAASPGDGDRSPDAVASPDPDESAHLAASAPREDTGRSDRVVESPPPAPDLATDDRDLATDDQLEAREAARTATDGVPAAAHERGRVVGFLAAVSAELQRVEWPDRRTLTTLTGVVVGFVIIAGAYLGLLDAIFSRLVEAIL